LISLELHVELAGLKAGVADNLNEGGNNAVLLGGLGGPDGLVVPLIFRVQLNVKAETEEVLTDALLSTEGSSQSSDGLRVLEPVAVGGRGELGARDEGLSLRLVVDNFMGNLGDDRNGPQVLGADVADGDLKGKGGNGGLLDVGAIGNAVRGSDTKDIGQRGVEHLGSDLGGDVEANGLGGLRVLSEVELDVINLEGKDDGVLLGDNDGETELGRNDLLDGSGHQELDEVARVAELNLLNPVLDGILSLIDDLLKVSLVQSVERGRLEELEEDGGLGGVVSAGLEVKLSLKSLDSLVNRVGVALGKTVFALSVKALKSIGDDALGSGNALKDGFHALSLESELEELIVEGTVGLAKGNVSGAGDTRLVVGSPFSETEKTSLALLVVVVLGDHLGVLETLLVIGGSGGSLAGSLSDRVEAGSGEVGSVLESRGNEGDDLLVGLTVKLRCNRVKDLLLGVGEHEDGESGNTDFVGLADITEDGEDEGKDLLGGLLGNVAQSVDSVHADKVALLIVVLILGKRIAGGLGSGSGTGNVGLEDLEDLRGTHMSEGLNGDKLVGVGVSLLEDLGLDLDEAEEVLLAADLLGESGVPGSGALVAALHLLLLLLLDLGVHGTGDDTLGGIVALVGGENILIGDITGLVLDLDATLVDHLGESNRGGGLEVTAVSKTGVLGEFKVSLDGLNVGKVHVLGNSLNESLGLVGVDEVGEDELLDQESGVVGASKGKSIEEKLADNLLLSIGILIAALLGNFLVETLKSISGHGGQSVDNLDNVVHGVLGGSGLTSDDLSGEGVEKKGKVGGELRDIGVAEESEVGNVLGNLSGSGDGGLGDTEGELLVADGVLKLGKGDLTSREELLKSGVLVGDHHDLVTEGVVDNLALGEKALDDGDLADDRDVVLDEVVLVNGRSLGLLAAGAVRLVGVGDGVGDWVVALDGGERLLLTADSGAAAHVEVLLDEGRLGKAVVVVAGLGDIENKSLLGTGILRVGDLVNLVDGLADTTNSALVDAVVSEISGRQRLRDKVALLSADDLLRSEVEVEQGKNGLLDVQRPIRLRALSLECDDLAVLVLEADRLGQLALVLLVPAVDHVDILFEATVDGVIGLANLDVGELHGHLVGGTTSLQDQIGGHLETGILISQFGDAGEKASRVFIDVSLADSELKGLAGLLVGNGSGSQKANEEEGKQHV